MDGIVDPLAGRRQEESDGFDDYANDGPVPPPADDTGYGEAAVQEGWTDEADGGPPPLDLSESVDDDAGHELQLGADQYVEGESPLATKPARGPVGGGDAGAGLGGAAGMASAGGSGGAGYGGAPAGGAPGGSTQGSTLFERMANLSRGSSTSDDDDDDEDEDGGSALNIPRFLNRQNNQ